MGNIITQAADLLVTASVGAKGGVAAVADWDIYAGQVPKDPSAAIGIMRGPGRTPNPKWALDYPSLQIRVRGNAEEYATAQAKAQEIKDALLGIDSVTIDSDIWVSVTMPTDIIDLGYDDVNRPQFAINFDLIIEPATVGNRTAI